MSTMVWRNWAGNQSATAVTALRPASVDEVAAAVLDAASSGRRVKPVGSGHSFTDIAVAEDVRLELSDLRITPSVDREAKLVTVPGGMPLRELNALLAEHGLAMPNLGDIDAQTVAGAISTGTHGTGAGYGLSLIHI